MSYQRYVFLILLICSLFFCLGANAVLNDGTSIAVNELSLENRRAARVEILAQFLNKYESNQTFANVYDYMVLKYQEIHKTGQPRSPGIVLQETFDKAKMLFDRTRPYVGNSFTRVYDPVLIEKNVHKYIWLKGFCFLVLGIGDEHKIALSYFYQPENEIIKQEFLKDVVLYSFPEVPDTPENKHWQVAMMAVMDRLGYSIFNIDKFVTKK